MKLDLILRIAAKLFLPFILLFSFYVQLHADYGPGGGFQAGVIAAAMIILYAIVFGLEPAKAIVPPIILEVMIPLGVLLYVGVGIANMVLGGEFLNYSTLNAQDPSQGQHLGILLVELGVLITVASTMAAIFYTFAGRGR